MQRRFRTRGGGLFSLFRRAAEALPPLPEGMLRPVARGQDTTGQDTTGQETAEAVRVAAADPADAKAPEAEGFFARLARRSAEARAAREAEELAAQEKAALARIARAEATAADPARDLSHPLAALRPKARKTSDPEPAGFFARLAARSKAREAAKAEAEQAQIEVAALPPGRQEAVPAQAPPVQETPAKETPAKEAATQAVVLPGFGEMTPVCGLPRRALGTQVARYPETGRTRYAVYDTVPGQAAPRLMYVTGFEDGCPRQIWAALALFGSFEMHEQVRYLLPASAKPYSDTDTAYEALKARTCGVKDRIPCGRKMPRLARAGVFLSLYERLGQGAWANILLHNGEVLAVEGK